MTCDLIVYGEIVGIFGGTLHMQTVFKIHGSGCKHMTECGGSIFPIGIFAEGGNQSCCIWRATGTGVPTGTTCQIMFSGSGFLCNAGNGF